MSCITKLSKTIKQSITQNKLLKIIIYFIYFIIFSIVILMVSSVTINWLVNTPNPFGMGFIDEYNKETWINFFGAIISGLTTLAGVWLTIKGNDNKRRQDLAMQYRPILNCKVLNYSFIENNTVLIVNLSLRNIGRAEALNVQIKSSSNLPVCVQTTYDNISMIEMDTDFKFTVTFVRLGREIENNQYERLPLDNMYDTEKVHPSASVEVIFLDIVDTKYCLKFDIECQHIVYLSPSDIIGLNLDQIQELVNSTHKTWNIELKNVKTSQID